MMINFRMEPVGCKPTYLGHYLNRMHSNVALYSTVVDNPTQWDINMVAPFAIERMQPDTYRDTYCYTASHQYTVNSGLVITMVRFYSYAYVHC